MKIKRMTRIAPTLNMAAVFGATSNITSVDIILPRPDETLTETERGVLYEIHSPPGAAALIPWSAILEVEYEVGS